MNCPSGNDELIRLSPRKNITAENCTVGIIHDLRYVNSNTVLAIAIIMLLVNSNIIVYYN